MKAGWNVRQIEEVTFIQEGPGIRKYEYEENGFPMINVRCVQDGYIDMSSARAANTELATGKWKHFQVDVGDILFTISGTIGRCAIVQESDLPLLMNTSVVRFRPIVPELDSRFLYLFLQSEGFQAPLKELSSGTAIRNVGPTHIKTLSIPLPPLEEQQRIVAVLDEAFEGLARARAHAEANLSDAEKIAAQALDVLLDELWSRNGQIQIDQIAEVKGGKRLPKGVKPSPEPTPFPYISVKDLTDDGSVCKEKLGYIAADVQQTIKRYTISSRDVYVSIAGTIGKTGIVPPELDGANLTENAAKLVLREDWSPEYVYWCTRSSAFAEQTAEQTRTAAQPKLALQRLGAIHIPNANASEQIDISEKMDALRQTRQSLLSGYSSKIQDLDDLRQSLLQKAFAGELT